MFDAVYDALYHAVVVGYNVAFDLRLSVSTIGCHCCLRAWRHLVRHGGGHAARRQHLGVRGPAPEPRLLSLGKALADVLQPRGQGERILLPGHTARPDALATLALLDAIALWDEPAATLAPVRD
jgi:hypothetical protein